MARQFQVFNYSFSNTDDQLDIHIDGAIVDAETQEIYQLYFGDTTSVSYKSFRNQIAASTASVINVYVNSPGGQVSDAMAMHDYLKDLQTKGKTVNTYGRGMIASAATYILMAGPQPEMSANSWFMIHNVSGVAWGDVREIERQANLMRKFNNQIRDFYATATGLRKEDVTKMMDAETWMTAQEAKDKGFIKEISGSVAFTNSIQPDSWTYSNKAVLTAYNSCVSPIAPVPPSTDIAQLLQNQTDDMKNFFTNLFASMKNTFKPAEGSTPEQVAEQILNALEQPFQNFDTELATHVNNQISEAVKGATDTIRNEYSKAIKDLQDKNTQLENDIANQLGKKTSANSDDKGTKTVGSFSKSTD